MGKRVLKTAAIRKDDSEPLADRGWSLGATRVPTVREDVLNEDVFRSMLVLERRRAQRSSKPFLLLLVDSRAVQETRRIAEFPEQLASVVSSAVRESDLIGWYEEGAVLGVIFTEASHIRSDLLRSKVSATLQENLNRQQSTKLVITVHTFPDSQRHSGVDQIADRKLYPDVSEDGAKKSPPRVIKRCIDIVGSAILLLLLSPILATIGMAIKLTSKGPMIFRQERLGQFGTRFQCLKFRTMHVNNDSKIHRDFVHNFIAGKRDQVNDKAKGAIFKITCDPRVTPIGKLLRKLSLDELPQLWNVLRGEMSLVGPRPPLPYEFEVYSPWHRRRVLEMRPGVTGLWQVSGRSRTSFDDMVRLDLRYSQKWSLWLDLKILLATPMAVFNGDGAY
jgi:exopolysaccharide biosynthesis polyprenyl glycosylphosphotransferase